MWINPIFRDVPILQRPKLFFYNPNLLTESVTRVCVYSNKITLGLYVGYTVYENKLFLYQVRIMLIAVFNNTHTVINSFFNSTDVWLLGPGKNIDIGWKIY